MHIHMHTNIEWSDWMISVGTASSLEEVTVSPMHIAGIGEKEKADMNRNTVFTRAQMPVFLFFNFYFI